MTGCAPAAASGFRLFHLCFCGISQISHAAANGSSRQLVEGGVFRLLDLTTTYCRALLVRHVLDRICFDLLLKCVFDSVFCLTSFADSTLLPFEYELTKLIMLRTKILLNPFLRQTCHRNRCRRRRMLAILSQDPTFCILLLVLLLFPLQETLGLRRRFCLFRPRICRTSEIYNYALLLDSEVVFLV